MAKVLVLYYSSYGHIETMAKAVAEGATAAGAQVDIKRVPVPRFLPDRSGTEDPTATQRLCRSALPVTS